MICFAKPGPPEFVYSAKGRIFNNMLCAIRTLDERPSTFIRDKPTFWSERMLHKNYDRNGSVEKKILVVNLKGFGAKTN
jgi:hypothetical protein